MLVATYTTQPMGGAKYTDLFRQAFSYAAFERIDIAVAYATLRGIFAVRDTIESESSWEGLDKRWVLGIDWCRSEPSALEYIASLPNSHARIFDGQSVVNEPGCVPSIPFHPKVFILRSDEATAVVCGSANLSLNGQSRGHEVGSLLASKNSEDSTEGSAETPLNDVVSWFEHTWSQSSPLADILLSYRSRYEASEHLQSPVPTEDDVAFLPNSGKRALSERKLRQLRACRRLWVQAGNLHANLGVGKPGNQLMLSRLTRVFFGFPAIEVQKDTLIGHVRMEFQGNERTDCSLRYSNNAMDVLSLPIPGTEGPPRYDGETLLFEQIVDAVGVKYILRVGSSRDRRLWRRESQKVSGNFKMKSGRQWGVS